MSKTNLAAGTAPFAHLLGAVFGKKAGGKQNAEDGDLAPDDDDVVDQDEVDDALDDKDIDDIEDGGDSAKKGKKAKGKGAKAEDEDDKDDDAKASEPEDDKEAKAFRRGVAAGAAREKARGAAIFSTAAAAARPDVAAYVAFGTSLPTAEAIGMLNTAATPVASKPGLADRMANRDDPKPGADGGPDRGAKPTFAEKMAAAKKRAGVA